ncbi:alpha/beta fold hydrolase [Kitasatospora acidiphila]|uniref:alpha/beta fold hydrolase n=1 Tax=Kitasatospora acidiphila TaxID=2567942 RepID=UPI003C77E9E3
MAKKLTDRRNWRLAGAAAAAALALATASGATFADAAPEAAHHHPGPLPGFRDGYVENDGIRIHYVVGGHGPALVLLHGWPETWQAWSGIAPQLAQDHTVIAVDLRGLGDSQPAPSDAPGSYAALTLATDVHAVTQQLGLRKIDLAGHDVGGGVALAYAAEYRDQVDKLAILEAPPTTAYLNFVQTKSDYLWWDAMVNGPQGDMAEQLVAGREKVFYSAVYAGPAGGKGGTISPETVKRYIEAYSRPGSTHAGFEFFRQQDVGERAVQDLIDENGKLTIPVLGVGGQYSMNSEVGDDTGKLAATNVTTVVVPNANHWVMEEQPQFVTNLLSGFFKS